MKAKKLLSIAIMATLPFAANATDPVGPAAVPSNGTPVVATASGPYQTATIDASDGGHIASTAYVKGAYNDTIAAINNVHYIKQEKLNTDAGYEIDNNVIGVGIIGELSDDYFNGKAQEKTEAETYASDKLMTGLAVLQTIGAQRVEARDTWGSNHTAEVALIHHQ